MSYETIQTERLVLRSFRDGDAKLMSDILGDIEVSKNLAGVGHPYTISDARKKITELRLASGHHKFYAMAKKEAANQLIGSISYGISPDSPLPEFGYWLSPKCWGNRLMSEAVPIVVAKAFIDHGWDKLVSRYWNPISGRILDKTGFKPIEFGHNSWWLLQGKKVNEIRMELSKVSWAAQQKGRAALRTTSY